MRNDLKKYAEWLLTAPYGAELETPYGKLTKNFKLEDVGFTIRDGKFFEYDPLGIGKRVSKEYVLTILEDALQAHPEIFFEKK